MKTKFYILAALASIALASCTSDDFVGDNGPNVAQESTTDAINFGGGFKAITRADHVGADAAALLNNKFIVGGFKGASTAANNVVFDNYAVEWVANTAGQTESNTSDWEYVGKTKPSTSSVSSQTIKYWDYSQTLYDFVAYSLGNSTGVTASAFNTTNHSFTLAGTEAELSKCYIADRVTVEKADFGKEVTLSFRNVAAKVRVALYETIPGYSVKDVFFYQDNGGSGGTGIGDNISSNTSATLIGTFTTGGTYTITYPGTTKGESDYNKAHVALAADPAPTTAAVRNTFGTLNYTAGEGSLQTPGNTSDDVYLQRTSTNPSFAGTDPYYQTVLPNETGTVMELRINYTLVANDGSGETITIHGAKAFVPSQFTMWLPNYAYTYIFTISDNSNGWTSTTDTDPAGLYPITFDAVVVDSEDNTQTTITTVATPSITTYQKGHDYTAKEEYAASTVNAIYVQVMKPGTTEWDLAGDLGTKGQLYAVSGTTPYTEAAVWDALGIQASSVTTGTAPSTTTITGRNGIILTTASSDATITTIPREDGNNITVTAGQAASFPATAGTYAYVYDTDTWDGIKVTFASAPTDWSTIYSNYYTDKACTTAATTTFDGTATYYKKSGYIYTAVTFAQSASQPSDWATDAYYEDPDGKTGYTTWDSSSFPAEGKTLYRRYTADTKIYGVKVIKVQ